MNYPLLFRFKTLAIARQIAVTDATDNLIWYVKQQAFKLKEAVTVFADREQTRPLFQMKADRVIDWSAVYRITTMDGHEVGSVQRRGMQSLWKAHYELQRGGVSLFEIREANAWAKVGDAVLGEIPILGFFAGYVFHPRYTVTRLGGAPVLQVEKKPAFLEGKFEAQSTSTMSEEEERFVLLGVLMMLLLEKRRG
jgi:hypothetical protein